MDRILLAAGPREQARWLFWLAALLILLASALSAFVHPLVGLAAAFGAILAPLLLRNIDLAFLGVVTVILILPFGALPFGVGFDPTFLDLTLGALYAIWIMRLVQREQTKLYLPPLSAWVLILIGLAFTALIAGLSHTRPTNNQFRIFGELIMGLGLFFVIANLIEDRRSLRRIFFALVSLSGLAAFIGLLLYVLPNGLEMRILSLLDIIKYPSGPDVLRFLNDDPARLQRATGTSIDPNSFGGMLAAMAALVAPQMISRKPLIARWQAILLFGLMSLALLATVSRGSLLALGAGLAIIGLFRDRRLLAWAGAAGLAFLVLAQSLPWTRAYVEHFTAGLMRQDRSTVMRMGEYKDALILIDRYPSFGVGFGSAPDIDLYRGVSSLYLLIAETMGLIGLAAFVILVGLAAWRLLVAWRSMPADGLRAVILGCLAALTTILAGGIFDHFYFSYPHAFALLWLIVGLGMRGVDLAAGQGEAGASG